MEVTLCPGPHINVVAIVRALLSRRRQTVLETVQHSSALLTRVHIATGALWLPDLAPVDSDDQRSLFQVLQLSPWIEEPRPEATSSFALTCFQRHFSVAPQNPFLFRLAVQRLRAALEQAFVRGDVELGVGLKLVQLVLFGSGRSPARNKCWMGRVSRIAISYEEERVMRKSEGFCRFVVKSTRNLCCNA